MTKHRDKLLSLQEAAEEFDLTYSYIYREMRRGTVPSYASKGGYHRIMREDAAYLAARYLESEHASRATSRGRLAMKPGKPRTDPPAPYVEDEE